LDELAAAAEGDRSNLADYAEDDQQHTSATTDHSPDAHSSEAPSSANQHRHAQSMAKKSPTTSEPLPSSPSPNASQTHHTLDSVGPSAPYQSSSEEPRESPSHEFIDVSQMTEGMLARGMQLWGRVFQALPSGTEAASRDDLVKKNMESMSDEESILLATTSQYMRGMFQDLGGPFPVPSETASTPPPPERLSSPTQRSDLESHDINSDLKPVHSSLPKPVSFASTHSTNPQDDTLQDDNGGHSHTSNRGPAKHQDPYAEAARMSPQNVPIFQAAGGPFIPVRRPGPSARELIANRSTAATTGRGTEGTKRKETARPGPLPLNRVRDGRIQNTTPHKPSQHRGSAATDAHHAPYLSVRRAGYGMGPEKRMGESKTTRGDGLVKQKSTRNSKSEVERPSP
jgi:hypothetical protein